MKKFGWIAAGGTFLLAFGMTLSGDGAKITGLITGQAAFVDTGFERSAVSERLGSDLPSRSWPPLGIAKAVPREESCAGRRPVSKSNFTLMTI